MGKHSQSNRANVTLSVEASGVKQGQASQVAARSQIDHKSSIPSHVTGDQRSQSPIMANRYSDHQASSHALKPKMVHADSSNSMHYLKITIGRSKSNRGSQSELVQNQLREEQERKNQKKLSQSRSRLFEQLGGQLRNVGKKSLLELGVA